MRQTPQQTELRPGACVQRAADNAATVGEAVLPVGVCPLLTAKNAEIRSKNFGTQEGIVNPT